MDLTDMQIFLAIVKYNSISKAGESLFLSQSNISRRLKLLEEELGVQLINRCKGQNGIELTDRGKDFIEIAQRWIDTYEEAITLYKRQSKTQLSVAGVHSLNFYVLGPLYQRLTSNDPPIELSLHTHHTWEIYDMMNSRQLDIGFVNNVSDYPNITIEPIIKEDFCVIRKPGGTCSSGSIHPSDLEPDMEIYHSWFPEYQQWHDYWWNPNKSSIAKINATPIIEYFLEDERHWAIVPLSAAKILQASKPLEILTLTDLPPKKTCYLLRQKQPRAGSAKGLEIFETCLSSFLRAYRGQTEA